MISDTKISTEKWRAKYAESWGFSGFPAIPPKGVSLFLLHGVMPFSKTKRAPKAPPDAQHALKRVRRRLRGCLFASPRACLSIAPPPVGGGVGCVRVPCVLSIAFSPPLASVSTGRAPDSGHGGFDNLGRPALVTPTPTPAGPRPLQGCSDGLRRRYVPRERRGAVLGVACATWYPAVVTTPRLHPGAPWQWIWGDDVYTPRPEQHSAPKSVTTIPTRAHWFFPSELTWRTHGVAGHPVSARDPDWGRRMQGAVRGLGDSWVLISGG